MSSSNGEFVGVARSGPLGFGVCLDAQCVYVGVHHRSQRVKDEPVSLDAGVAVEPVRDDVDCKMPFAILGACMAGMQVALVLDQQVRGFERICEDLFDFFGAFRAQGRTSLKGFTVTDL